MTVLLTGAAGFIGKYVAFKLAESGVPIIGLDSLEPRVHRTPPVIPLGVEFHVGHVGICPLDLIERSDVVIHLAAQVGVADSMTDPLRYVVQNTMETAQFLALLEKAATVKRIVVASSMSVYGEGGLDVRESEPCVPQSVYGQTKYDQERLVRMWGEQHKVPAVALRFFNVYGPGQALHNPYTGVLANFANRLLHDESPIIYEDGLQIRDWIYADDVADAVCIAAMEDTPARTYNISTGRQTTLLDAARMLTEAMGKHLTPIVTGTKRPGDVRHCSGDPKLAYYKLRWAAKTPLEEGLKAYADSLPK